MREREKIEQRLLRAVGRAVVGYRLIRPNDRIAVALSGGKDSIALFRLLKLLQERAPVRFSLQPVYVDSGFSQGFSQALTAGVAQLGGRLTVLHQGTAAILKEKLNPGENPCPLCARLRRGILYTFARRQGFQAIALGHHADDFIETLLLNQFYCGQLKAMPPMLEADGGGVRVIRPLCLAWEADLRRYVELSGISPWESNCPARAYPKLRRQRIKALLAGLEAEEPGLKSRLLASLWHCQPRFLFPYELRGADGRGDLEMADVEAGGGPQK